MLATARRCVGARARNRVALVPARSTLLPSPSLLLATVLLLPALLLLPLPARGEPVADDTLRRQLDATRAELSRTQQQLEETRSALSALAARVEALQPGAATSVSNGGAPDAAAGAAAADAATSVAASATSGATARLAPVNANNPAISVAIDTRGASNTRGDDGVGFDLANAELFLSAPIDPFLRGYASIVASSESGFDVEEAALVTTALPGNLTLKGGRFFADVGRLPKWHDEALPFAYRPLSIDRIIGGESGAEGLELAWLAPTDTFVRLHAGVYDAIGSELREDGSVFSGKRSFSELTYLAHPSVYFELSDRASVELGGTWFQQPHRSNRRVAGLDVTFRDQPGGGGAYAGTTVGAEWYWSRARGENVEPERDPASGEALVDVAGDPVFGSRVFQRFGGYGYVETFLGRRVSVGALVDYAQAPVGAADLTRTYSAFATWRPSEFQRLRAQVDQIVASGVPDDQRFTLQWTAFLGSHSHGFSTR